MKLAPLPFKLFIALLFASLAGLTWAADSAATAASPYRELESFVGGVWVAKIAADGDRPAMRLELRYAWNENKQGVRFDSTWFVGDRPPAPYVSGMYAWNAAKKTLVMFYTDSTGGLAEGTATTENGVLVHEMTLTNKGGTVEKLRFRITKIGATAFDNEILGQQGGEWKQLVQVRYERRG